MRPYYSPKIFSGLFIIIALFLSGCVSNRGGYDVAASQRYYEQTQAPAEESPSTLSVPGVESERLNAPANPQASDDGLPPVKVAILLPLSGKHEKLGRSMLNAAQLALFDVGHNHFELLPKDTQGTPDGAREAAKQARNDGVKLILGPVFSSAVRTASPIARSARIKMIAFSTDWTLANSNTFLMGFMPFDQVERVVNYAAAAGYSRIGALGPTDSYGNGVIAAYQMSAQRQGIYAQNIQRFAPHGGDLNPAIRKFSNYDVRKAEQSKGSREISPAPVDAVLMPVGGALARQVGSFLNHYDLPPRMVKRLGTGLMDDPILAKDKTLEGAWFAAPSPDSRLIFEQRYNATFYHKPLRLASLSYDATALAAILARTGLEQHNRPAFDHVSITNPNGFAGIDGIFRFRADGIVERGLAILEYRRGEMVVIDPAPKTFQQRAF